MRTLSSIDPFLLRRARLLEQMRRQGGGIAIIPTAPERPRNSDAHHHYRHDSDFYYFDRFYRAASVIGINCRSQRSRPAILSTKR